MMVSPWILPRWSVVHSNCLEQLPSLVRGKSFSSSEEGHAAASQEDQDPQTMSNTTTVAAAASLSEGEAVASSLPGQQSHH